MTGFVAVGKISSPVGLRGELKVIRWTDTVERFELLKKVWIGSDESSKKEFDVEGVRIAGANVVIKFVGIDDRTAAEQMVDKLVLIPDEETVQPVKGSYYIDDVVGMKVVTEEGKEVGVVCEILRYPSNDLWQVDSGSRIISIPAVKEFIRKVDLPSKTVVIHEIEGLLEL